MVDNLQTRIVMIEQENNIQPFQTAFKYAISLEYQSSLHTRPQHELCPMSYSMFKPMTTFVLLPNCIFYSERAIEETINGINY